MISPARAMAGPRGEVAGAGRTLSRQEVRQVSHSEALTELAGRFATNPDLSNVVAWNVASPPVGRSNGEGGMLQALERTRKSRATDASGVGGLVAIDEVDFNSPQGLVGVAAMRIVDRGNSLVLWSPAEQSMVITVEVPEGVDGAISWSVRYQLWGSSLDELEYQEVARSQNGEMVRSARPVSTGVGIIPMDPPYSNKCGPGCCANGPGGYGYEVGGSCVSRNVYSCLAKIAAYTSCLACRMPKMSWPQLIFCVSVSCPWMFGKCCTAREKPHCRRCRCRFTR